MPFPFSYPNPNPEDCSGKFYSLLSPWHRNRYLACSAALVWSFMADNLLAFPLLPLNPSWCSALPGPALLHLWVGVGVYISIYISLYIVYILLLVLPL